MKSAFSASDLEFGIAHPRLVFSYLMSQRRISNLIGCSRGEVKSIFEEKELARISKCVIDRLGKYKGTILGPSSRPRKSEVLYAITRLTRPSTVVETGVQSGISSAYILAAMEKNGDGRLCSVDLPDESILRMIPSNERFGLESGWVVPGELRHRWQLILGKSKEKLPELLNATMPIDVFFHDSEHSYENMMWEYRKAWNCLADRGFLLSDDINTNPAFRDFCHEVKKPHLSLLPPLGGVRKT